MDKHLDMEFLGHGAGIINKIRSNNFRERMHHVYTPKNNEYVSGDPRPPRDLEFQTFLLTLPVGVQRLVFISLIIVMKPFSWTNWTFIYYL